MIKIVDFLSTALINPDLRGTDRGSIFKELIALLTAQYRDLDPVLIEKALDEREKLGSTGIGEGVAIPHAKIEGLRKVIAAMGRSAAGVEFDSPDGKPVHLFFLIIAPINSVGTHLTLLARINSLVKDEELRQALLRAADAEELLKTIEMFDKED